MKAIPIGISNFEELRNNNYYFVDKTNMIQEFLERKSKVTLITRPRRFGKTLNMSMMASFFDVTKDSKYIFENTEIMNSDYINEMNRYPTIFISFANAKRDRESIITTIKKQILSEWAKYEYVFKNLNKYDQKEHDYIESNLMDFHSNNLNGINDALSFLMERLYAYYNKQVMVFIDEYDTPFVEAHVNDCYEELRGGLSGLLHNSLKTSDCLKYALLTGIQRVAKENIFSDLNNLDVNSVLDTAYSEYFGFNTDEVNQLLNTYGLTLNDDVKSMYDGYKIGSIDIYNPWSILNYAQKKELIPYWINTSANTMIKENIKNADLDYKDQYEDLIKNGYLDTQVNTQTSFYEVKSTPNLWGLFVNAGYLTIDKAIDITDSFYRIRIPNEEVNREFRNLTEYYLSLNEGQLNRLLRFLIQKQPNEFIKEYKNILMLPSYHDLKNENSYHMMMLGMCLCLSRDYEIISNREAGKGRFDIVLKAKYSKSTSFVLEFKYLKGTSKNLESDLDNLTNEAIEQIQSKNNSFDLKEKVIYIGLAHHGKDVKMKWVER